MRIKATYHILKNIIVTLTICCATTTWLASCDDSPEAMRTVDEWPQIYPYYINVTIPAGMSPLNFSLTDKQVTCIDVEVIGSNGGRMHVKGKNAVFNAKEWKKLTTQNIGHELTFSVRAEKQGRWLKYRNFQVSVRN